MMRFIAKTSFMLRYFRGCPKPGRECLARFLIRLGVSELLCIRRYDYELTFFPTNLSRMLWIDPDLRLDGELFFNKFLKPGMLVVDVGANIGAHTLMASSLVGLSGSVEAIEAHPRIFRFLLENLKRNTRANVNPVNCAVGEDRRIVAFSDRNDDDWNCVEPGLGSMSVLQKSLDELCANVGMIDLLKIDVEGYELSVLRGAADVLARTRCVIVESWNGHFARYGHDSTELVKHLAAIGFSGHLLHEQLDQLHLVPVDINHASERLENLVFFRQETDIFNFTLPG